MNLVKGKRIVCAMIVGGNAYPIFCAKTAELVLEQDVVEVTSVNSGSDREYEPGMASQSLNCTGIHILDNTGSKISANYLRSPIRKVAQAFRITQTDDDGNVYVENFTGIIERVSISRDVAGYAQSAVDIKIIGATSSTTVLPPNPDGTGRIYLSTTPGAHTVSNAILSGKTILEVELEGVGYDVVSGTPITRQCNFSGTTITFEATLAFDTGAIVFVLYQS